MHKEEQASFTFSPKTEARTLSSEILNYIIRNKQSITTYQTLTYFLRSPFEKSHFQKTQLEKCVSLICIISLYKT